MGEIVRVNQKAIVIPLAIDTANVRHLEIERVAVGLESINSGRSRKIAIGSDHGGFVMKLELKKLLASVGS